MHLRDVLFLSVIESGHDASRRCCNTLHNDTDCQHCLVRMHTLLPTKHVACKKSKRREQIWTLPTSASDINRKSQLFYIHAYMWKHTSVYGCLQAGWRQTWWTESQWQSKYTHHPFVLIWSFAISWGQNRQKIIRNHRRHMFVHICAKVTSNIMRKSIVRLLCAL